MTNDPENKPEPNESEFRLFGQRASVRAVIVLVLVVTVCIMSVLGQQVMEPLYTLAGSAVGFYFGGELRKR